MVKHKFSDGRAKVIEQQFADQEKESTKFFEEVGTQLYANYPGLTQEFISLHDFEGKYNRNGYRAVSAFKAPYRNVIDARFGDNAFIDEVVKGEYRQSVKDGAEELAGFLEDRVAACPGQLIYLGGYSQGAHVVGDALILLENRGLSSILTNITYVSLFGDPKFNGYYGTGRVIDPYKAHRWTRGSAPFTYSGSLTPRQAYIPDSMYGKVSSWCGTEDFVCGGLPAFNPLNTHAHAHWYVGTNGKPSYIQLAAKEMYMKSRSRVAAKASGQVRNTTNAPVRKVARDKLDVVYVADVTGDMEHGLIPVTAAPDYFAMTKQYYPSLRAGFVSFNEYSNNPGLPSATYPFSQLVTDLTTDLGKNGYFISNTYNVALRSQFNYGYDFPDTPYSAIDRALGMQWRADARKIIVVISNSYGLPNEPQTGKTLREVIDKAKAMGVEVVPLFGSYKINNPGAISQTEITKRKSESAAYYKLFSQLAGTTTHEVTTRFPSQTLLHDVVLYQFNRPRPRLSLGGYYQQILSTQTAAVGGEQSQTIDTPLVFGVGEVVALNATETDYEDGDIVEYAWDFNDDGTWDEIGESAFASYVYTAPYSGDIVVRFTTSDGQTLFARQKITVTYDDALITHRLPSITLPTTEIAVKRDDSTAQLTWTAPNEAVYLVLADEEGQIIAVADAQEGNLSLTGISDGPSTLTAWYGAAVNGSQTMITIPAKPAPIVELPSEDTVPPDDDINESVPPVVTPDTQTEVLGTVTVAVQTSAYTPTPTHYSQRSSRPPVQDQTPNFQDDVLSVSSQNPRIAMQDVVPQSTEAVEVLASASQQESGNTHYLVIITLVLLGLALAFVRRLFA